VTDIFMILFALGLPLLAGSLFVCVAWSEWRQGGLALVIGLGFPLGLVGVVGTYVLLDALGIGLQFCGVAGTQFILVAGFALILCLRSEPKRPLVRHVQAWKPEWKGLPFEVRLMVGFLLGWLAFRWIGVFVEVLVRPLQPWDAWSAYGLQAKVWFYEQHLNVFGGSERWFATDESLWDGDGLHHPPGIALTQLWLLQSINRWDPALMNLAWPVGLASLGLIVFSLVRLAGGSLLLGVGGVWILFSIPILNVSVVLAGMGDFWIGVYLLVGLSGIWLMRLGCGYGIVWVIAVAMCGLLTFKNSGIFWFPVIGLAFASCFLRLKLAFVLVIVSVCSAIFYLYLLGEPVRVSWLGWFGFADGDLVIPNLDSMWDPLARHLFIIPNWHLLWYVAPVLMILSIFGLSKDAALAGFSLSIWAGVVLLALIFRFSFVNLSVVDGTGVNRYILHLVPSVVVFSFLTLVRCVQQAGAKDLGLVRREIL
jgi:hypothetical protein